MLSGDLQLLQPPHVLARFTPQAAGLNVAGNDGISLVSTDEGDHINQNNHFVPQDKFDRHHYFYLFSTLF